METVNIEERDTSSLIKTGNCERNIEGSSIFTDQIPENFLWNFQESINFLSMKNLRGTTISVLTEESKNTPEGDYELSYFNDNYDIVAKAPINKSFKINVKIRSISRLQPKVFIDNDELNQVF